MAFILSEFVVPTFEYQLDPKSEAKKLDYYETAEKLQSKEIEVRRKYMKKLDKELGESLDDYILQIQKEVIFKVFELPKETNVAAANALFRQFMKELKEIASVDEEVVKN